MKIDKTRKGDVMVVTPDGWSIEVDTRKLLMDELVGLADAGEIKVLVDLSALDYMTSGGLSALLFAARRMVEVDGKFALCSLNDNVKRVFEISSFDTILDIYPSVDEALAGLR